MGLAQIIPPMLQFYGFLTAGFAAFYALMYWGARQNVRVLGAMGRHEVEYYYRFIEVVELARPVALPIGALAFLGGLSLSVLFDGAIARASGLVSFSGYIVHGGAGRLREPGHHLSTIPVAGGAGQNPRRGVGR